MTIRDETEAVLQTDGYNVSSGTFGAPYKVPKGDGFLPVIASASLPNYTEQEIVVIDLLPAVPSERAKGEKVTTPGQSDWWASCSSGIIDPRPRAMSIVRPDFERILSHGGIFIVFSDRRNDGNFVLGYQRYKDFYKESDIVDDNWSFLSLLDHTSLEVSRDHGSETKLSNSSGGTLKKILSEHLDGCSFRCTLQPAPWKSEWWRTLATNKYGASIAGAFVPAKDEGWVFIFPQLRDRARFLSKLLTEVLPELSPKLFPHREGGRWVERPEYELPRVHELKTKIRYIEDQARHEVESLVRSIEEERATSGYLHDLLTEKDIKLVRAVKRALEVLGFESVVDMDEDASKAGSGQQKREDLQIRDASPLLLIEVKGLSGHPRDEDSLQVWKYLAPRMKELNRTDIQGLSVINHQRNLPALDRGNTSPFREDILTNAKDQSFGLMTTWDLYRLTRNYLKHQWKHDDIKGLFYGIGRVEPIPRHYILMGVIETFWEKASAIGVRLTAGKLCCGDRIGFELPVEFEEQDVESLQLDGRQVEQADIGMLIGLKTRLSKEQARKGVHVYRIMKPSVHM